jgi:hypothetical protein
VTFKDLKKRVSLATTQQQSKLTERLQDKPFWIWDKQQHKLEDIKADGDCCFNHIIGLPQKDGNDKPLYDYEQIILDSLVAHGGNKHLWIKKATGLVVDYHLLIFFTVSIPFIHCGFVFLTTIAAEIIHEVKTKNADKETNKKKSVNLFAIFLVSFIQVIFIYVLGIHVKEQTESFIF